MNSSTETSGLSEPPIRDLSFGDLAGLAKRHQVAVGGAGMLAPDQQETIPASLYRAVHHPDAAADADHVVTTKDKLLSAILSLLARHGLDRIQRDQFASQFLYDTAVANARGNKHHAMQLMLALSRIEDFSPKYIVLACEAPLLLENALGGFVLIATGTVVHSHKVGHEVVQMLKRALLMYWRDHSIDPESAAQAVLPLDTAALFS